MLSEHREKLEDVTPTAARAEGLAGVPKFFDYWTALHGDADPTQPVWMITFELEEAPPRLLANRCSYTSEPRLALPGEPEAISAEATDSDRGTSASCTRSSRWSPTGCARGRGCLWRYRE